MIPTYRFPVTIITPSRDSPKLRDCLKSVRDQTYQNYTHMVVYDGVENITRYRDHDPKRYSIELPVNTGNFAGQKFYGHRIYAAFSHLVNSEYVLFLDEDNWLEPNHVQTLVETIETDPNINFSYSLRNIYNLDKTFICRDDCESLGQWPIWNSPPDNLQYLIDTSSFCFRRNFIQEFGHLWHSGWGGDRRFLALVAANGAKYKGSGKYTLNYRLDGNPGSVNAEYFRVGNDFIKNQLKNQTTVYPWSGEVIE